MLFLCEIASCRCMRACACVPVCDHTCVHVGAPFGNVENDMWIRYDGKSARGPGKVKVPRKDGVTLLRFASGQLLQEGVMQAE